MDKIKPQSGVVKQNEVLLKENNEWLYFSNPHQIIAAEKLEDVLPALQEIERLIAVNAWYAAGFLSYEAAPAFDSALQTRPGTGFPYLWFGLYPEPRIVTLPGPARPKQILDWHPIIDREAYSAAVAKIKDCIAEGKTYQVNYTLRMQTRLLAMPGISFSILHKIRTTMQLTLTLDNMSFVQHRLNCSFNWTETRLPAVR